MPDQEDAEAEEQDERGGPQPRQEQHLRLFGEMRPAAARDLALGTANLRLRAGRGRGLHDRLAVNGRERRLLESAVHGCPFPAASALWLSYEVYQLVEQQVSK